MAPLTLLAVPVILSQTIDFRDEATHNPDN
jgi:hypothetical protein